MNTKNTIEIEADQQTIWQVFADVSQWSEWTDSVQSIQALDGPELKLGHRFRIKQPWFPKLVWQVTELKTGHSWTWEQRSVGGLTLASHVLEPLSDKRTLVTQSLEQTGPLGALVGRLVHKTTQRYLKFEAQGLKTRCEQES